MVTFKDLVDVPLLQQIADSLYSAGGIPVGIISVGYEILVATGWQDICTKFHRVHPDSCKLCYESDSYINSRLSENITIQYKCKNGMWDIAVPLIIDNQHLATLFLGQFFYCDEKIDYDFFEMQAKQYGFDSKKYMEALGRVPSFTREQVTGYIDYYRLFVQSLAAQGLQNLKLRQEIEARKVAEIEISKLRNLLKNVIDSMPSILIGVDIDGRVIQWNRSAEIATGVSADQAINSPIQDVYPSFSDKMEHIRQAIINRTVQSDPHIIHHDASGPRYESITIFPLISNGIEGAVIRIDDITERTRIDNLLLQSEKMMSVGGLAAGMAHEINNPLAAIIGSIQTVMRRISGELEINRVIAMECGTTIEAVEAYLAQRQVPTMLARIQEAGTRAAHIISNMLAFSRRSSSECTLCSVALLLDTTLELAATDYDLRKSYDFKKIAIKRFYEPVPDLACHPALLQQVFFNILRNGAEAMYEKMLHCEQTPTFLLRISNHDTDAIRIEIEDNGPGIPFAELNRIFEPFFTSKPVGVGTGLGLSVSYFIITEEHGGTIRVESQEGSWTRFTIILPLRPPIERIHSHGL